MAVYLPDEILHQILRFFPTKPAVQISMICRFKNWSHLWSSVPVLDFEEGDTPDKLQHERFINFVNRCLEFRQENKTSLDLFRLHMKQYRREDITGIDNWLGFSLERGVKELDLSFRSRDNVWQSTYDYYYKLSQQLLHHLLDSKPIDTLKLEFVKIESGGFGITLPSLKSLALNNVLLDDFADLSRLIAGCPSLQYLSLTSLHEAMLKNFRVSSSRLKSMEVTQCPGIEVEVKNLECFAIAYKWFDQSMTLFAHTNLRNFQFSVNSYERSYPTQLCLCFSDMNSTDSMEEALEAGVALGKGNRSLIWSWKQFSTLRNFLSKHCGTYSDGAELILYVYDCEAFIFPENFRNSCPPPMPGLKRLKVFVFDYMTELLDSDLRDSLNWMAPSATIKIIPSTSVTEWKIV